MSEQTPLNWLWGELHALLPQDQYDDLRARYSVQYKRYDNAAKLRQARRDLAHYERMVASVSPTRRPSYERKVENRKATIARLEALLAEGAATEE